MGKREEGTEEKGTEGGRDRGSGQGERELEKRVSFVTHLIFCLFF